MSTRPRIVVLGDALLDIDLEGTIERLCPDAPVPVVEAPQELPRPGGAALAAALVAREQCDVILITALAVDGAGARLRQLITNCGVEIVDLGHDGQTAEKIRVRAGGQSVVRIDRGSGDGTIGDWTSAAGSAINNADAILVADYGRGMASLPAARRALEEFAQTRALVWDPHPKGLAPVPGAVFATPNRSEAVRTAGMSGQESLAEVTEAAQRLTRLWGIQGVCVTLGSSGALYQPSGGGTPVMLPAVSFEAPDACGAGDRFAGAATVGLARGNNAVESIEEAVVAASAFVGAGGAAGWSRLTAANAAPPMPASAGEVINAVKRKGGTVVATGGCFDVLHAGHVRLLEAARRLGDCLIVCVNSDESVSRLKGPDRPLNSLADRVAVLESLSAVDAVVSFDQDTPAILLSELRPDIWAKGGDYEGRYLAEAEVMAEWGGATVVLPYLPGRSTTDLVNRATSRQNR